MKYLRVFGLAILAGVMIALGGLAYVACCAYETTGVGKIIGSILFATGLLAVCAFGLFLYTGRIGYAFEKKADYLLALLVGYLGNIVGACGVGYFCFATAPFTSGKMGDVVATIANSRDILAGGETWYSALLLGVLCGVLVFVGVDLFKRKPGVIGTLALIFAVATFVVGGTEHCIANMFYFSAANHWNGGTVVDILLVTLGNSLGSLGFWGLLKLGGLVVKGQEPASK
ncbi:MAG: putative formate transporter 1 [Tenericutes bacterium ADurb.BinA155]|jgi:formate/nitrite transporter FocA (FNT family)|nr:MAG: putative formate transporter 1 [Tenericutes bacterium ADurb.BinA155]